MHAYSREDGFTLTELMVSTTIVLVALSTAMTTFKNAINIHQAATQMTDASQNLRAGTNLVVRDLMQAARGIPIGGIPIPSGVGSHAINRPSPPQMSYAFDNINSTHLNAITTGSSLGPIVDGSSTDIVTFLMTDPLLSPLPFNPNAPVKAGDAYLAADGSSVNVGASTAWLQGDTLNGLMPLAPGDLIWIQNPTGSTLQTVTRVDATHVYFDLHDAFNFNQPGAASGSVTQLLPAAGVVMPQGSATRLLMLTYYVDAVTTAGTPRLTKVQNLGTPQALAGVVEDLDISYDIVDGGVNPTQVKSLPVTINGVTYSPNQIRKVNLHVGVRSDTLSPQNQDYIRSHLSTVVSIRSLAFVNRYK